jgi:transposase-like protein
VWVENEMRQYTTEQRQAVLADVSTVGVLEAARRHNIPTAFVSRWARAASVTQLASTNVRGGGASILRCTGVLLTGAVSAIGTMPLERVADMPDPRELESARSKSSQ